MLADNDRTEGLRIVEILDGGIVVVHTDKNEVLQMPRDVYDELVDPEYITRKHYSRATYAKGCHGPLCRLRENLGKRQQQVRRAERNGETYEPDPRMSTVRKQEQLAPIILWHEREREGLRLRRQGQRQFGTV